MTLARLAARARPTRSLYRSSGLGLASGAGALLGGCGTTSFNPETSPSSTGTCDRNVRPRDFITGVLGGCGTMRLKSAMANQRSHTVMGPETHAFAGVVAELGGEKKAAEKQTANSEYTPLKYRRFRAGSSGAASGSTPGPWRLAGLPTRRGTVLRQCASAAAPLGPTVCVERLMGETTLSPEGIFEELALDVC